MSKAAAIATDSPISGSFGEDTGETEDAPRVSNRDPLGQRMGVLLPQLGKRGRDAIALIEPVHLNQNLRRFLEQTVARWMLERTLVNGCDTCTDSDLEVAPRLQAAVTVEAVERVAAGGLFPKRRIQIKRRRLK